MRRAGLGRSFGWLWAAYSVSALGSWLAFDAFGLVAVLALHAPAADVSLLAAIGLAVGAMLAVPLGPWVETRRKRRVMVAADLIRFAALAAIPGAYAAGRLGIGLLMVVSAVVAAATIVFGAASGAYVKSVVAPVDLLAANARLESTRWTAVTVGPPLGGALVGAFGPVVTVLADAASYLLSALALCGVRAREPRPAARAGGTPRAGELLDGWRTILGHRTLRRLLVNTALVNSLIMATAPLMTVLLLGRLHLAPWRYGLAFALPCLGGLAGTRLAGPLVARFAAHRVLRGAGTLRCCWTIGLAFVPGGWAAVGAVMGIQLGLVTCCGAFNPVFATYRLEQIPDDRVARTLSAWTVTTRLTTAALTAGWGLLAALVGVREAIGAAGVVMLATPLLLPRHFASRATAEVPAGPPVAEPATATTAA